MLVYWQWKCIYLKGTSSYYYNNIYQFKLYKFRYVSQVDLESADNCQGKYTVGLGQHNMAFVDDREGMNQ